MLNSLRLLISSIAAAVLLCGMATPAALAAKGGGKPSASSPTPQQLSQTYEYVWNSPNPGAPTWCLNEDDWHIRTWTGALNGSFVASERLCDRNIDAGWGAGGIGLQADLVVAGTLGDLSITSPLGDSRHAVFVDATTSKNVTLNHYRICYVPYFSLVSGSGGTPLPGGNWQITLSGDVTNVGMTLRARMANVDFQQQWCPASQQNLG